MRYLTTENTRTREHGEFRVTFRDSNLVIVAPFLYIVAAKEKKKKKERKKAIDTPLYFSEDLRGNQLVWSILNFVSFGGSFVM